MKKFNKNILVFVFCMLFVGTGLCSEKLIGEIGEATRKFVQGKSSVSRRLSRLSETIDNTGEKLSYHNEMVNVNSLKENLLGTRVVFKDDITVVKMNSGSLSSQSKKIETVEIEKTVRTINRLKNVSEENGAKFLYCAAPTKQQFEKSPENIDNYAEENYQTFLKQMSTSRIPYIDIKNELDSSNVEKDDIFYLTDHHWDANAGFFATEALCRDLNSRYGFLYDEKYLDLSNYIIQSFNDYFLGSLGRKAGAFFTWHGADDFELISPNFKTNLSEEQPFKNQIRTGEFKDTFLYMDNMVKDYYNINTYATYSGGDFRLQIMKNNSNSKGKKFLMIRDSFACVVAPFLALQTNELHVCDVRNADYYVGPKLNIEEYIKKINPDYVIVLYSGVGDISDSRYNFF